MTSTPSSNRDQPPVPISGQDSLAGSASQGSSPVGRPAQHVVRRTRVGGLWVALGLFALVLLLLLIFILENGRRADISFFGAHAHLPLGVALLLAAVFGVLLVVIPGTARIMQLRRTARHRRTADVQQRQAQGGPPAATADNPDHHPG